MPVIELQVLPVFKIQLFHRDITIWEGDGPAVNMPGQHVYVLRVRVPPGVPQRLIWRMESLDRGLILVCRFSFVSIRDCSI
jgi:hypothetical protein